MNVLRMICRWTGVCHVPDSTTRATWTTCWRWKLIYYTSGVVLTIIVRKNNILGIMTSREKINGRSVVDMWQMVKRKYIAVDMIPSGSVPGAFGWKCCVHWRAELVNYCISSSCFLSHVCSVGLTMEQTDIYKRIGKSWIFFVKKSFLGNFFWTVPF